VSRDDGFTIADISTTLHEDSKFKRLARRYPGMVATAFMAFTATLLDSWRDGERLVIEDAWPMLIPFDAAVVDALKEVELLDAEGRVEAASWAVWFEPAKRRRDAAREAGRKGNRLRWHPDEGSGPSGRPEPRPDRPDPKPSPAEPIATRSGGDPDPNPRPYLPTYPPTGPSVPRAPAHEESPGPAAPDPSDPADSYWTLTGKYPTEGTLKWIDDMAEQFGADAVGRAIASEFRADGTVQSLLGRAKTRLRRDARAAQRSEDAAEKASIAAKRAPLPPPKRAEDVSAEEADRIAREWRALGPQLKSLKEVPA
jgi:hypothetical protein